jgi:hypothetical protein
MHAIVTLITVAVNIMQDFQMPFNYSSMACENAHIDMAKILAA